MENEIIEKWLVDNPDFADNVDILRDKINNWLKHATTEEESILLLLFSKSHFFSKKSVFLFFKEQYEKLVDIEYTIFSAIESQDYRNNSSHKYLNEFSVLEDINDYSVIPSLSNLRIDKLNRIRNIIFMDDIIGTGKTVIDFLDTIKSKIIGKKIYLWVICITEYAKDRIKLYASENNLEIIICSKREEKKAFEQGYIFNESDSEKNKKIVSNYENNLWKRPCEYILGKDDSQCLVSFYNDTPNNTLSSFWFKDQKHEPIFSRKKKTKPKWFSERKKERIVQNYERKM